MRLNLFAMCLDYFFGLSLAGNPPFQHNVDPEVDDCSLALKKHKTDIENHRKLQRSIVQWTLPADVSFLAERKI